MWHFHLVNFKEKIHFKHFLRLMEVSILLFLVKKLLSLNRLFSRRPTYIHQLVIDLILAKTIYLHIIFFIQFYGNHFHWWKLF